MHTLSSSTKCLIVLTEPTSSYAHSVSYQLHADSHDFAEQYFQQHDSFLHRQLQTDGQTGAHLQGFFCLHETQLPSLWRRQGGRGGWTSKNYVICVCFHCHGTSSYHTTNTLQGRRAKSHVDTQTIQPGLGDLRTSYCRPPIDPFLTPPLLQNHGGATVPSTWQWQMMVHIHHKQQPFGCVSAVAECSSVSKNSITAR